MRLTPLVTVTVALCSLAACASSGSGASAPPPAVVTPSTRAAASSAPPPVPAPSTPATAEGAIAFVKAYYAEMNHALYTSDGTPLTSYYGSACPCRKFLDEVTQHSKLGQHWTTDSQVIDSIQIQTFSPGHAEAIVHSHWSETELVDSNGHVVSDDPGHVATERIVMDRATSKWSIAAIYGSYKAL